MVGFRDCTLEVSRYLVNTEGFDINHPLRLRLLSHLQNFTDEKLSNLDSSQHSIESSNGYMLNSNNHLDYISSSSSSSSIPSPKKFESNPLQLAATKHYSSSTSEQPTHFSNSSSFVQINITSRNKVDNIEDKLWHMPNYNQYSTYNPANSYLPGQIFNNSKLVNEYQKSVSPTIDPQFHSSISTYWNQTEHLQNNTSISNQTNFAIKG
jgi:hypothetical protein